MKLQAVGCRLVTLLKEIPEQVFSYFSEQLFSRAPKNEYQWNYAYFFPATSL